MSIVYNLKAIWQQTVNVKVIFLKSVLQTIIFHAKIVLDNTTSKNTCLALTSLSILNAYLYPKT